MAKGDLRITTLGQKSPWYETVPKATLLYTYAMLSEKPSIAQSLVGSPRMSVVTCREPILTGFGPAVPLIFKFTCYTCLPSTLGIHEVADMRTHQIQILM